MGSSTLVIRDMKLKPNEILFYTRMAKRQNYKCWQSCGTTRTFIHCVSKCQMVYPLYRIVLQFHFSIKLKYSLHIPKRNKSICVQKHLYENVHESLIHNSPKLSSTVLKSIGEQKNKLWSIHKMGCYTHRKEWTYNMDES